MQISNKYKILSNVIAILNCIHKKRNWSLKLPNLLHEVVTHTSTGSPGRIRVESQTQSPYTNLSLCHGLNMTLPPHSQFKLQTQISNVVEPEFNDCCQRQSLQNVTDTALGLVDTAPGVSLGRFTRREPETTGFYVYPDSCVFCSTLGPCQKEDYHKGMSQYPTQPHTWP